MNPVAVMISHASRANGIRLKTLEQLAKADITPTVFESTVKNGSDVEVKRIAWTAVSHGLGCEDGVLFFEDDLEVSEVGLRWFLEQAAPDRHDLVVLCLLRESLYPPFLRAEIAGGTYLPSRTVALDGAAFRANKGFHGSMGLWLSAKLVDLIVERNEDFMEEDGSPISAPKTRSEILRGKPCGFDFWLKDHVRHPAVLFPNPVDHVPNMSVIGSKVTPHRSPSFPR